MKNFKITMVVFALLILSGCASQKDFVRPAAGTISLGKTTHEEVIKTVGKPFGESKEVDYNGEKIRAINYFYTEGPSFWGMIIEKHSLVYTTSAGIVVGEEYNSSYAKDKTEFDLGKMPQIKKGMPESDVIALMGKPSGILIYPLVKDKAGRGLVYGYSYARFAGMLTSENNHLLIVSLDANGLVTEVVYKKDGKEKPIQ